MNSAPLRRGELRPERAQPPASPRTSCCESVATAEAPVEAPCGAQERSAAVERMESGARARLTRRVD